MPLPLPPGPGTLGQGPRSCESCSVLLLCVRYTASNLCSVRQSCIYNSVLHIKIKRSCLLLTGCYTLHFSRCERQDGTVVSKTSRKKVKSLSPSYMLVLLTIIYFFFFAKLYYYTSTIIPIQHKKYSCFYLVIWSGSRHVWQGGRGPLVHGPRVTSCTNSTGCEGKLFSSLLVSRESRNA